MAKSSSKGRKRVTVEFPYSPDSDVFIAGTFNAWNPSAKKMARVNGTHRAVMLLPKGRHEYKFVVDGTWQMDPDCSEWVPNPHGSFNSVLTV